jgi:hypothetical protein
LTFFFLTVTAAVVAASEVVVGEPTGVLVVVVVFGAGVEGLGFGFGLGLRRAVTAGTWTGVETTWCTTAGATCLGAVVRCTVVAECGTALTSTARGAGATDARECLAARRRM